MQRHSGSPRKGETADMRTHIRSWERQTAAKIWRKKCTPLSISSYLMHAWCFVAHTYCTYFTVMHWSEGGSCVCFVFVFAFQIVFVFGKQKEDFVFVVGIGVSIAAQIVCFHLIWFVLFNFDLSRFYLYLFPPLRHHWNCLIWLHHITLAPAESSLTARQISLRKTTYFIAYEKLFVTLLKYILLHICKIYFCQNCMVPCPHSVKHLDLNCYLYLYL